MALLVGLACKNVTAGSAVFCGGAVVLVLLGAKGCLAAGITLPGVGYVDLGIAAPLLWEGLGACGGRSGSASGAARREAEESVPPRHSCFGPVLKKPRLNAPRPRTLAETL